MCPYDIEYGEHVQPLRSQPQSQGIRTHRQNNLRTQRSHAEVRYKHLRVHLHRNIIYFFSSSGNAVPVLDDNTQHDDASKMMTKQADHDASMWNQADHDYNMNTCKLPDIYE